VRVVREGDGVLEDSLAVCKTNFPVLSFESTVLLPGTCIKEIIRREHQDTVV
jgi:hypothetical protein